MSEEQLDTLIWYGQYGYYPAKTQGVYNEAYFNKYKGYAATPFGVKLNEARLQIVEKYYTGLMVDVGIGCGQFVKSRPMTCGYDVNPFGIQWLKDENLWLDPYKFSVAAMSFWDSLEHIAKPDLILRKCLTYAFVSMPIFKHEAHVLQSKHYRKDEHYWYFTTQGFIDYAMTLGFSVVEISDVETRIGREDILTFVLQRL